MICNPGMEPIPGFKTTFMIEKPGNGPPVSKGNKVTMHATGVVKETGKKFWSTKDPGQTPFQYTAGVGQVITGWDQVCARFFFPGVCVGGMRACIVHLHICLQMSGGVKLLPGLASGVRDTVYLGYLLTLDAHLSLRPAVFPPAGVPWNAVGRGPQA